MKAVKGAADDDDIDDRPGKQVGGAGSHQGAPLCGATGRTMGMIPHSHMGKEAGPVQRAGEDGPDVIARHDAGDEPLRHELFKEAGDDAPRGQ